ncbi:hypothetical protein KDL44_04000 [bacterium]|nr:hypothetical protein [bacterium]
MDTPVLTNSELLHWLARRMLDWIIRHRWQRNYLVGLAAVVLLGALPYNLYFFSPPDTPYLSVMLPFGNSAGSVYVLTNSILWSWLYFSLVAMTLLFGIRMLVDCVRLPGRQPLQQAVLSYAVQIWSGGSAVLAMVLALAILPMLPAMLAGFPFR